ncbi:MAG: ribose-phosphate pyrophosphokinase [Dehalococcoidia bacterium]|nr:ribose-phosphate pyrophosphokinase [Dehalococcoidia bacterium]|tara:strand:+ start:308 stop:1252 length:945 start_codon:yes stop_codon:yes gene_type:complete
MSGRFGEIKVFSGTSHPQLTQDICTNLGIEPSKAEIFKFENDNTFVRILNNVREQDVFIVQPTDKPSNDNIMELLICMDAARRASAGRVTAVIPYFGYGRTDKKDQPRVPISARLIADLITTSGADRILTMDLHAPQIQGFFNIPVDELTATPILIEHFKKMKKEFVVVATDVGISKKARDFAARLSSPLAIIEKRRSDNKGNVELLNVIGDVDGKTALTFDDEIDTGGSLAQAIAALSMAGVNEVYSCATHGIFSGNAIEKLSSIKILKQVVVTDSVSKKSGNGKIKYLSVSSLIAEAISRIQSGRSVGELFK